LWFEERVGRYYRNFIVCSVVKIGQSKLYFEHSSPSGDHTVYDERYSLTPNGYLYKNLKNFVTDRNIRFQAVPWDAAWMVVHLIMSLRQFTIGAATSKTAIFLQDLAWINKGHWEYAWRSSGKMLENLSADELRILRNTLYAMRGYIFNDPTPNDHFNRPYWHFPNPNIALTDIALTAPQNSKYCNTPSQKKIGEGKTQVRQTL